MGAAEQMDAVEPWSTARSSSAGSGHGARRQRGGRMGNRGSYVARANDRGE